MKTGQRSKAFPFFFVLFLLVFPFAVFPASEEKKLKELEERFAFLSRSLNHMPEPPQITHMPAAPDMQNKTIELAQLPVPKPASSRNQR